MGGGDDLNMLVNDLGCAAIGKISSYTAMQFVFVNALALESAAILEQGNVPDSERHVTDMVTALLQWCDEFPSMFTALEQDCTLHRK
jgi:hypothetical protein